MIGGLATGTAASAVSAPAYAQGKRRLKMVTTWPKNFPGLGTAPENIAKRVSAMTDSQIEIKIYAAGELVGAFEIFDAVSTGTADMYIVVPNIIGRANPPRLISSPPFLWHDRARIERVD